MSALSRENCKTKAANLASSGLSHQCCQLSRDDIPRHIVQQPALLPTRQGHGVLKVLPRKDILRTRFLRNCLLRLVKLLLGKCALAVDACSACFLSVSSGGGECALGGSGFGSAFEADGGGLVADLAPLA